jgi:TolB-like protein
LLLGLAAGGCAGGVRSATVTPEQLAALEADQVARPEDPDLIARTGIAYYVAGRHQLARDVLAMALTLSPDHYAAAVHLGLAQEALGDLRAAREAYQRAAGMPVNRAQRREVENRLGWLARQELAAEARVAVAREQEFANRPLGEDVVAVLPFHYLGADDALRPLGRGLTHLVVSDLAKVERLTLLEREQVQAIATELGLSTNGHVAPDGAVRSGRLLGAARVVQGSVREAASGNGIQVSANVVRTADGVISATGQGEDRLQRLFDLEKQIVLDLLDQLGIVPTPAERRAIGERPTTDLQAFLAFSRGLEAEDRGDFSAARRLFESAALQDAGFGAARQRGADVQRIALAMRSTPERLAATVRPAAGPTPRGAALGRAVSLVAPSTAAQLDQRTAEPSRSTARAQVQEGLNRDDPTLIGLIGTIIIVVPRP